MLGPSNGPSAGTTCQIDLLLVAKKLPTNPVIPGTGTTITLGRVTLQGATSGTTGSASSTAEITVSAVPSSPTSVPTLSEWVMMVLVGFLVLVGAIALRKRTT